MSKFIAVLLIYSSQSASHYSISTDDVSAKKVKSAKDETSYETGVEAGAEIEYDEFHVR